MRDERELETTGSRGCLRLFLMAFGTAALIGLLIGVIWVIAGLLHFHPLW